MNLRELWKKYDSYNQFNVSVLSEEIKTQGVQLVYPAGSVIISLGDFPDYILYNPVLPSEPGITTMEIIISISALPVKTALSAF